MNEHMLIISGQELEPPAGLKVTNFHSDEVLTFNSRNRRGKVVDEIIIHESVTRSVGRTVATLRRRGLGVHLMVAPDGSVTQHNDLADERLAHAGQHNRSSVGLEVVNPYEPKHLREGLPWKRVIEDARWAHGDSYVLPTPEQAEAVAKLIGWLTSVEAKGLEIPRKWIGRVEEGFRLYRVEGAEERSPGIYAHHNFAHSDGSWPALYSWLRLERGLPPCVAYEEAVRLATGVRRVAEFS